MKFGIGQPVRRHEDLRLITGLHPRCHLAANDACRRGAFGAGACTHQARRCGWGAADLRRAVRRHRRGHSRRWPWRSALRHPARQS